jgi:predicted kinase
MIRLYPGLSIHDDQYGDRAEVVRTLIWDLAAQGLQAGVDVALDWNSWSAERRRWVIDRAQAGGATIILHWLQTGKQEATVRSLDRWGRGEAHAHQISSEDNAHLATLMEDPTHNEGLTIVRL